MVPQRKRERMTGAFKRYTSSKGASIIALLQWSEVIHYKKYVAIANSIAMAKAIGIALAIATLPR